MNRRIGVLLPTIAALVFALGVQGRAQSPMTRHMHEATLNGEARQLGRLPSTQIMQLDIVLPLRDQAGLDAFLSDLYNPASSHYRKFLTLWPDVKALAAAKQDEVCTRVSTTTIECPATSSRNWASRSRTCRPGFGGRIRLSCAPQELAASD